MYQPKVRGELEPSRLGVWSFGSCAVGCDSPCALSVHVCAQGKRTWIEVLPSESRLLLACLLCV